MSEIDAQQRDSTSLSRREVIDVEDRAQPRTPVIYEVIRRQGEDELARPLSSLWWSGVAAGLSISFSLLAEGILRIHLPEAGWRPLIEAMGYPVGFLMVILSRQQLFTENTITVVLPVMREPNLRRLCRLAKLWSVVFLSNMAGTFFSAVFFQFAPALTFETRHAMVEISQEMMSNPASQMFFKGIPSGFLIAAMVWAIPSAETAKFHIIALMTYLVAIGGFTHIVAGSVEAFLLVTSGEFTASAMLMQFTLPVLFGNIVGGTLLFALISYAQVMHEI